VFSLRFSISVLLIMLETDLALASHAEYLITTSDLGSTVALLQYPPIPAPIDTKDRHPDVGVRLRKFHQPS